MKRRGPESSVRPDSERLDRRTGERKMTTDDARKSKRALLLPLNDGSGCTYFYDVVVTATAPGGSADDTLTYIEATYTKPSLSEVDRA